MDFDFWLSFYQSWDIKALEEEIGHCFLYQQNCLNQVATGQSNRDYQLRQLIQSQQRVLIIYQVIRHKERLTNEEKI